MIPHRSYPFRFRGDLFRECEVFNPNLDYEWGSPPGGTTPSTTSTRP